MKTFASFALYALSIVVAVGIGMLQVGKSGIIIGAEDCNASSIVQLKCNLLESNKSDSACSSSATFDVININIGGTKAMLVVDREGAVMCSGCKETQKGIEDVTAKNDGCTSS